MKEFFRFLRGELDGFYLKSLSLALIKAMRDRTAFLSRYSRMQWKTYEQCGPGESPVPSEQLHGICTVAGVFPPYAAQESLLGSLRFTLSHKVDGEEYSDRGLLVKEKESFDFYRTDKKTYTSDINTLASSERCTSLVEPGAALLGFFQEGDKVIREDGTVDTSLLFHFNGTEEEQYAEAERYFKEQKKAYSPYYGSKYLFLAEESPIVARTTDPVLLELLKAEQYVRRNGQSMASLSMFASILCPNFLFIVRVRWQEDKSYAIVYYGVDDDYIYEDKLLRTDVFKIVSGLKFKQLAFMETQIKVVRDDDGNAVSVTETHGEEQ